MRVACGQINKISINIDEISDNKRERERKRALHETYTL